MANKYFCKECKQYHSKKDDLYKEHKVFILDDKYFCLKCNKWHYKGKLYELHKEFFSDMTKFEIWKLQFKQNWNNYSKEKHIKSIGSMKQ